jgi:hypothetical protein
MRGNGLDGHDLSPHFARADPANVELVVHVGLDALHGVVEHGHADDAGEHGRGAHGRRHEGDLAHATQLTQVAFVQLDHFVHR